MMLDETDADSSIITVHVRHRVDGRDLRLCYRSQDLWRLPDRDSTDAETAPMSGRLRGASRMQKRVAAFPEIYGYVPQHPILCWDPFGERMFLSALRCPNGHRFAYHRIGSLSGHCPDLETHKWPFERSEPGTLCPVDKYSLECHGGEHRCHLYFDMYHEGFLLQPAPCGLRLTQVELEPPALE
jgi:hypothetical protein